jgi:hypothetical protein
MLEFIAGISFGSCNVFRALVGVSVSMSESQPSSTRSSALRTGSHVLVTPKDVR